MVLALIFGKYFTNEPILKKIMGKSVSLTNEGWEILNKRWVLFFFAVAILNELSMENTIRGILGKF